MEKNLAESLNSILDIIDEKCTDAGGGINVDPNHLDLFAEETSYLKDRMGLDAFQAILFAVIIICHANDQCNINNVGKRLGMSYLKMLSYSKDLYALRERGLIRLKGTNNIVVPGEVMESIMSNQCFEPAPIEGLGTRALLRRIFSHVNRLHDGDYTPYQFVDEVQVLLDANPQTSYAAACEKYKVTPTRMSPFDRALFHVLAYLYIRRDYTVFDMGDVEDYFKDEEEMDTMRDFFDAGNLGLQIVGIIEPAKGEGMRDSSSFSFNENVVQDMFADINIKRSNLRTVDVNDLSNKPVKHLFYNAEEKGQIERLSNLLEKDSLQKVFASMKEKGLRTGMICLFYGDPGTGKTETVYQMARRTGRCILEADVAKLRNCYVGETEKNMRALFNDYRLACTENEHMPILLFNEADAILGSRMEGAVRSVDRMENSVQNILLQEMENFEGILIATTNLIGNLDPAFERRFLFKVRFNKPELESRTQIWRTQIPSLSEEDAHSLADEFAFSGGQIENVVRKSTIDSILSGAPTDLARLRAFCREESIGKTAQTKIGF